MNNPPSHVELVTSRTAGFGMNAELFGRQDVFENDVEIFFRRHWIVVAVTADITERAEAFNVTLGNVAIDLIRGNQGQIEAYRRNTVEGEHTDRAPAHCKVVGAHVFVCLAETPPDDFALLEQTMLPRFAPYDLLHTKVAFESDIIERGNWKLVMENNRECYHCSGTHPELIVSFLSEDLGVSLEEMNDESRQAYEDYKTFKAEVERNWEEQGLLHSTVEYLDEDAVTQFRTQRMIIAGSGESQTLDTRVACTRLLGDLTRRDLGDTHLWTHSSWTHVMSDHAIISWIVPLSPERTLVRSKWLVHKDAVEGVDYDLQRLTEVWVATNQQDANLVAITHSGTQDPGYIPGPFSIFTEPYVDQFSRWYAARIQAHIKGSD